MKPGDAATTGTQPEPEPRDPTAGLIAFLRSERFQATAEDIADAFWLAERLPGVPRTIPVPPDSASTTPGTDRPGPEPMPPPKPAEVPDWRYIYAARTDLELPGPSVAVRVPSPPTLPETLAVAKALRPLMRREPSRLWYSIDPDATARRQTEERIWEPVLMPQLERWLSVALVLDVGSSMDIWHPTLNALRQLLEQMGAFRRVHTWILKTDVLPPILDSYRPGVRGATTPSLRLAGLPPRTILEPGGRHLVLVVSDCVGRAWHEGEVARLFAEWHRAAPVALIQILPGWLWPRTALSVARPIRFLTRGSSFASKPQWLIADDSDLVAEPLSSSQDMTAVPIPIATLEPESLHDLARTLSGRGALHGAGVLLEVPDPGWSFRLPPPLPSDPDELVGAFRRTATGPALRLATLLAAAPTVNLPIIRLVAEAMMPGLCRRQHQAEVWLAGLLQAVPETAAAVDPEEVRYDFRPGIRDRLLDALPRSDAIEVLERTSTYIERHLGRLSGLAGMLANPKDLRPRGQLKVTGDPLARIASDVLLRLGGDYARLVQETKPQASKRDNHAASPKSGVIRIFVGYSRRDKRWLNEFRTKIQPLIRGGLIDPWDDSKIKPGQKRRAEIVKAIEAADIAVLLVSSDFLASEFIIGDELPRLLAGRKTVFWIAIDHSNYEVTPIANYQCANDPSAPLASLTKDERSRAWVEIAKKLRGMISGLGESVAWNVPYPRNPNFTGREAILAQLEATLAPGMPVALAQAIAGLGGVGKTQTAVEFAYRHRDRFRAVLWVPPTPRPTSSPATASWPRCWACPRRTRSTATRWSRPSAAGWAASRATCWSSIAPTIPPWSSTTCLPNPRATSCSPRGRATSTSWASASRPSCRCCQPTRRWSSSKNARAARGCATPPSGTRCRTSRTSWITCHWRWSRPPPTWSNTGSRSPTIWPPTASCG